MCVLKPDKVAPCATTAATRVSAASILTPPATHSRTRRQRGNATLELGLVLLPLMALIVAIIDFSFPIFYTVSSAMLCVAAPATELRIAPSPV